MGFASGKLAASEVFEFCLIDISVVRSEGIVTPRSVFSRFDGRVGLLDGNALGKLCCVLSSSVRCRVLED